MGICETVPGVSTSPTGKLVYNDPIMSKGSLLLFDPTHSMGAFSGVPAAGALLPNVASAEAQALIGTTADVSAVAMNGNGSGAAETLFVKERSGRGGLSGQYAASGMPTSGTISFGVNLSTALRTYLLSVIETHQIFFSTWFRVTRGSNYPAGQMASFHWAFNTTNYLFYASGGAVNNGPASDTLRRNANTTITQAAGTPVIMNCETNGISGTGPGTMVFEAGSGAFGPWNYGNINAPLCGVLERVYIEDLTVSGRTYAEVDAIDLALHTAAHAEGGRWYDDTWTDPATLGA